MANPGCKDRQCGWDFSGIIAMTEADGRWRRESEDTPMCITDSSGAGAAVLLVFAIIWNGFFFMMALGFVKQSGNSPPPPFWFFGIFFLAGAWLLFSSVHRLLNRHRYGPSVLVPSVVPIVPGGVLAGVVQLRRPLRYRKPIHLNLAQYRMGDKKQITIWQEIYSLDRYSENESILEIPVYFKIPADGKFSHRDSGGQIVWRLDVSSKGADGHFSCSFQIPVSNAPLDPGTLEIPDPTATYRSELLQREPLDPHIERIPMSGGVQFEFSSKRYFGVFAFLIMMAVFFVFFGLFAYGIDRSVGLPSVFVAAGLASGTIGLWFCFLKVTITIRRGSMALERRSLFWSRRTELNGKDIEEIAAKFQGSMNNKPFYAISARDRSGKSVKLCGFIRDKFEADWLAGEFTKDLPGS
jgi:hypothetical protein